MIASYSPVASTGLVRPPVRKATPDDPTALMPPVQGAGATTPPATAPAPIPGVTALPFGNGVSPVNIDPGTSGLPYQFYGGAPVNTVSAGNLPTSPSIDPQLPAPASYPAPGDPNDLSSALIAPPSGGGAAMPAPYKPVDIQPGGAMPAPYSPVDIQPGSLDPRISSWQSRVDSAAGDLGSTDRRGMLNSLLSDFDKQSLEGTNRLMTLSGRKSATFGRIGSGMAGQDVQQIARKALSDREIYRNQLAADTIDKEIGDRFGKLSAFSGASNDAYGQGANDRAFNYDVASGNRNAKMQGSLNAYNQAAADRGFNYDVAAGNRSAQMQGSLQAYNQAMADRAQAAADRGELRTERAYQTGQTQTAIDRQIQQVQIQEALKAGDFSRAMQLLQQGNTGNPAGAYAAAGGDQSAQSSQTVQMLMDYLKSLGYGSGSKAA